MTQFFWNFAPFLTAGLVALTIIFGVFCAKVELRLAARKKISLANYKQKSNLFYITKDKPFSITAVVLGLVSAVFAVLFVTDGAVWIYAIPLGVLVPVNAVAAYLAFTRHKCARDVRVFDVYYVQVEDVLRTKSRTMSDIRICQQRIEELRSRLAQTIDGFNRNLERSVFGDFLPELFAPLDKMIADYLVEIDRFTAEVEQSFNDALREFLHEGTVPELSVVPLRHFDEISVNDLLGEIKSSYGGRIAEMVVEQVDRGAIRNARALGNIMSLLHQIEVEVDVETLSRFLHAASRFDDRAELAELLYRNRQITLAMVRRTFIPQNWEWTFVPGMTQCFNRRELTMILSDVLAQDRKAMCYRLLYRLDASSADILSKAVEIERERADGVLNETARLASAYMLIITNTYAVGNSGNVYENLGYMLYDHVRELSFPEEVQQRIVSIVQNEAFYAAREEIAGLYTKAQAAGAAMVDSTTRILLQYIMEGSEDFLDPARLAALFGEYRTTLSFGDMSTMRALLSAWLLMHSRNAEVLNIVLGELCRIPVAEPFVKQPPVNAAGAVGRHILEYLTQKDRVRLRSVVYRTESNRLTLDRVLTFFERGNGINGRQ